MKFKEKSPDGDFWIGMTILGFVYFFALAAIDRFWG